MPRGRPKKTIAEKAEPLKPALYSRGDNGLLENIDYSFNEDGSVNWRAMIREEHLFPNKSWFEGRQKEVPTSTDGLADHQLLIKLGGIKELAKLRGFRSVGYTVNHCTESHVAVTCEIEFTPNYETSGEVVRFQDMANATLNNTSSFATKFLEAIACNRAFIRCVRNFLNVHIVGDDEIDKSSFKPSTGEAISPLTPNALLEKEFSDLEIFKNKLRTLWSAGTYKNEDAATWNSFSDIPPKEARLIIKAIRS